MSKRFLIDAAERVGMTFLEAALAALVAAGAFDAKAGQAALIAGLTAAAAVLKTIVAKFVGAKDSAALLPATAEEPERPFTKITSGSDNTWVGNTASGTTGGAHWTTTITPAEPTYAAPDEVGEKSRADLAIGPHALTDTPPAKKPAKPKKAAAKKTGAKKTPKKRP